MSHKEKGAVEQAQAHGGFDDIVPVGGHLGPIVTIVSSVGTHKRQRIVVLNEGAGQVGIVGNDVPSNHLLRRLVTFDVKHFDYQ